MLVRTPEKVVMLLLTAKTVAAEEFGRTATGPLKVRLPPAPMLQLRASNTSQLASVWAVLSADWRVTTLLPVVSPTTSSAVLSAALLPSASVPSFSV